MTLGREDEDEESRKLHTLMAFILGVQGGPESTRMPRDVFRVVLDMLMPLWDPLRRRNAGRGGKASKSNQKNQIAFTIILSSFIFSTTPPCRNYLTLVSYKAMRFTTAFPPPPITDPPSSPPNPSARTRLMTRGGFPYVSSSSSVSPSSSVPFPSSTFSATILRFVPVYTCGSTER